MKALRRWIEVVVEPRRILGLRHLPRFFRDWRRLRRAGMTARLSDTWPQLADRTASTPFDPHYFFQGAWLARQLAQRRPTCHVDVGSDLRVVGVVSAFVPTTFLDLRPAAIAVPGLTPQAGDLNALPFADGSLESLSCMHVIEHIGLGRYGDPIDPDGSVKACRELARVLRPGGWLFLSTPVGQPRVEFNAHRIFDPQVIESMVAPLALTSFAWVDDRGRFHDQATPEDARSARYACGMFAFQAPPATHSGLPGATTALGEPVLPLTAPTSTAPLTTRAQGEGAEA
ncbi:MAG: class I SAM-dependent methyltransferase [Phycisphaeraceae bacterium]|nr:class I SAM-dependent methyltransferase [Phycisphaeraceae bacterium]